MKYSLRHWRESLVVAVVALVMAVAVRANQSAPPLSQPLATPPPSIVVTIPAEDAAGLGWWTGWQQAADARVKAYCSLQIQYLQMPSQAVANQLNRLIDQEYRAHRQLHYLISGPHAQDLPEIPTDQQQIIQQLMSRDFDQTIAGYCGMYLELPRSLPLPPPSRANLQPSPPPQSVPTPTPVYF